MRFVLQSKAASRESVKSPLHSAVLGEKWWFYYEEATYYSTEQSIQQKQRRFEFYRQCSLQFPGGRGEAIQDEIFSDTIKPFPAGRYNASNEFASLSFTRRKRSHNLKLKELGFRRGLLGKSLENIPSPVLAYS